MSFKMVASKDGGYVYQEIVAAYTFSLKDSLAKGVPHGDCFLLGSQRRV